MILEDRCWCLLHLEEQRVVEVPTLQQADVRTRSDAADPDDLAGRVDQFEALQQLAPIGLQRRPVRPQLLVHGLLELVRSDPVLLDEFASGTTIGG